MPLKATKLTSYVSPLCDPLQDIKVIGALGDSITAGFGIDGFWGGFTENRGRSWAMGGDEKVSSLASFVRRYSPSVQGPSVGSHLVEVCADYFCPSAHVPSIDNLNAAQSGAWVQNLPDQATWLIKQMGANPKISYNNDWKLITVLIGANNLCASCIDSINPYDTAAEFGTSLDLTLATLATIPRTFVNVVQIFNLSSVYEVSSKVSYCNIVHGDFPLECECDFDTAEDVRYSPAELESTFMHDRSLKCRASRDRMVWLEKRNTILGPSRIWRHRAFSARKNGLPLRR